MRRAPHESSRGWQQAMALTVWVYRLTRKLPDHEKSGLCAGMRRSATAVAQRLADADGRENAKDALKHYEAARASLRELLTAGLICRRLRYLGGLDLMALRRRTARVESWIDADAEACEHEIENQVSAPPLPSARPAEDASVPRRKAA